MKFKVGDKVKFIKNIHNHSSKVKLGEVYTIGYIENIGDGIPYQTEENREWFKEDELELVKPIQFTKSDLKDGDKCTLKDGRIVYYGREYPSNYNFGALEEDLKYQYNDDVSIVKVERPTGYKTVFERKEEILDEAEKRYLRDVIRPFRNRIKAIYKMGYHDCEEQWIEIRFKNNMIWNFPEFLKDTMYKNMEIEKYYTLEELRTIKE